MNDKLITTINGVEYILIKRIVPNNSAAKLLDSKIDFFRAIMQDQEKIGGFLNKELKISILVPTSKIFEWTVY